MSTKIMIHPMVVKALKVHKGSIADLAMALGIDYSVVYRWINEGNRPSRLARKAMEQLLKENGG